MSERKQKIGKWALMVACVVGVLITGGVLGWYWQFRMPYCVRMDCRGQEIDVEMMKRWEEREELRNLGILRMAGWRMERQQVVSSVSTTRRQRAEVICVYGAMELAEPANLLCGRFGWEAGENYCVLSEELARHLFGCVEVAGEWVIVGQEKLQVAGVIEKEEDFLLLPMKEGRVEMLAVETEGRLGEKIISLKSLEHFSSK